MKDKGITKQVYRAKCTRLKEHLLPSQQQIDKNNENSIRVAAYNK